MENSKHSISGIVCDVTTCAYNESGEKCTAPCIKVGGTCDCKSSCNTECVTFKPCC